MFYILNTELYWFVVYLYFIMLQHLNFSPLLLYLPIFTHIALMLADPVYYGLMRMMYFMNTFHCWWLYRFSPVVTIRNVTSDVVLCTWTAVSLGHVPTSGIGSAFTLLSTSQMFSKVLKIFYAYTNMFQLQFISPNLVLLGNVNFHLSKNLLQDLFFIFWLYSWYYMGWTSFRESNTVFLLWNVFPASNFLFFC